MNVFIPHVHEVYDKVSDSATYDEFISTQNNMYMNRIARS